MSDKTNSDLFCRNYKGLGALFDRKGLCGAGLSPRAITGGSPIGWAMRIPCTNNNEGDVKCEQFCGKTPEELAQKRADREKLLKLMTEIHPFMAEIKKEHKAGGPASGTKTCPQCSGPLAFNISSYNGHLHIRCHTDGCLIVME